MQDTPGLVVSTGVFLMSATQFIATPVVVFQEWDPTYLIFHASEATDNVSGFPLGIMRHLISLYGVCIALIPARYSILLFFYLGMTDYRIFALFRKINPNFLWSCIKYFRKCAIWANDFRPLAILINSGILSSFFAVLVTGAVTRLLALIHGETMMKISSICISAVSLSVLLTTFFCCCHVNEDSNYLLSVWANVARSRKNNDFLKLTVKSLQAMSLPAGTMGIFDRDITMNYFERVVE